MTPYDLKCPNAEVGVNELEGSDHLLFREMLAMDRTPSG